MAQPHAVADLVDQRARRQARVSGNFWPNQATEAVLLPLMGEVLLRQPIVPKPPQLPGKTKINRLYCVRSTLVSAAPMPAVRIWSPRGERLAREVDKNDGHPLDTDRGARRGRSGSGGQIDETGGDLFADAHAPDADPVGAANGQPRLDQMHFAPTDTQHLRAIAVFEIVPDAALGFRPHPCWEKVGPLREVGHGRHAGGLIPGVRAYRAVLPPQHPKHAKRE